MCGLAGYCGSKPPDLTKLYLLGALNTTRGTDNCGIYINGTLVKGVKDEKNFLNFIKGKNYTIEGKNNTVFIHTRNSTMGSHDENNAHPFGYPLKEKEKKFIFMHNGVINNVYSLAIDYGYENFTKNFDVDSQLLGDILFNGKVDVLGVYEGYAALAFTNTDEPNTIYLWKGCHFIGKTLYIERDLYYFQENGGLYFSSEDKALKCITNNKIQEVPDNTLLKIESGVVVSKLKIKRTYSEPDPKQIRVIQPSVSHNKAKDNLKELVRARAKGKIYWYDGLYYRTGHPVSGHQVLTEEGNNDNSGFDFWFFAGVLLKNKEAYDHVMKSKEFTFKNVANGEAISSLMKYVHSHSIVKGKHYYYHAGSGVFANGEFQPLFSYLRVNIDEGDYMYSTLIDEDKYVKNNEEKLGLGLTIEDRIDEIVDEVNTTLQACREELLDTLEGITEEEMTPEIKEKLAKLEILNQTADVSNDS